MKPIVQALLVADHIYTDEQSKKKIICGIFHRLYYRKLEVAPLIGKDGGGEEEKRLLRVPLTGFDSGSPFCYIGLTSIHGIQDFELRYVDLAEDKPLFGVEFKVDCKNPLETVEIVFPLPRLPHDKPGNFALELLWKNEPLGLHRITVEEMKDELPNA